MDNKYYVQINSDLRFDEVLRKLNKMKDNEIEFTKLNSSCEWLVCEDIVDLYIDKKVEPEMKDLFIEHKDGLAARIYSSDIIDYDIVEKVIKDYDFDYDKEIE